MNQESSLLATQACPMSASVHWNPKEDSDDDIEKWLAIYNKLPYQVRMGLVDTETENRIVRIAKKYNIYRVEEVGELSRIIRDSFVTNTFQEKNTKARILERLKVDEDKVGTLYKELFLLRNKISAIEEGNLNAQIEKIPFVPAIKKYPELNQQLLGERKIVVFGDSDYVKPTLKNWLDDYTLRKGAQAHSNLDRSDYIFNSENIKVLTFDEKKHLLSILESYDEDRDLDIDTNKKVVLFDTKQKEVNLNGYDSTIEPKDQKSEKDPKKSILGDFPLTGIETVELEHAKMEEEEEIKNDSDTRESQSKHIVNLKDI